MRSGQTRRAPVSRGPGVPQQATLLELFFDVVFVAAVAVISSDLSGELSWTGALRTLVPLGAIWWIWVTTTLLTDFYDPERPPLQAVLSGTMLGTVLAAVSVPEAFAEHGALFAGSCVAVHLGRGTLLIAVIQDGQVRRQAFRFLFWFCVSAPPWLVGALVHGAGRAGLWLTALAVDYLAGAVRYPNPWFGRVSLEHYRLAREHLGERYRQFVILALGDMILLATLRYAGVSPTLTRTAAFLLAFVTAALLWRTVILRGGTSVTVSLPRRAGGTARIGPYTHLTMLTAVVVMSAAFEVIIRRPDQPSAPAQVVAVLGGTALFLAGRVVFDHGVFFVFSGSRTVWALVLVALAPVVTVASPPAVMLMVIAVAALVGVDVTDHVRLRIQGGRIKAEVVDPRRQRRVSGR